MITQLNGLVSSSQSPAALDRENTIMARADAVVAQIDAMRGGK